MFERYILHRKMREEKVYAALPGTTEAPIRADAVVPIAYDDTPAHLWPIALLRADATSRSSWRTGRARESGGLYGRMLA